MALDLKSRVRPIVERLLAEGQAVLKTKFHKASDSIVDQKNDGWVDPHDLEKWLAGCRNVMHVIGPKAATWNSQFTNDAPNKYIIAAKLQGSLRALLDAIDADLLVSVEDLITADAFANLLEQADELYDKKYFLGAGVLGRAVLEEHLRAKCIKAGILPPGRPTINDLNQALYKAGNIDKLAMQQVTAMAVAGNHCAHNLAPPLSPADIKRFLTDVRDFLVRHPL